MNMRNCLTAVLLQPVDRITRPIELALLGCVLLCPSTPLVFAEENKAANAPISAQKFDFGSGGVADGFKKVTPETVYSKVLGYGFEPGGSIEAVDRGGSDALKADFCTSEKPFYFSVAVPEGNYKVTLTLGDARQASNVTVKAELRRLALEKVHTAPGEFIKRSCMVNVRTPRISDDRSVRLKEREKTSEAANWDEKLTLEFNDLRPCVCAIEIQKAENIPTVYLLGDSTVCDQPSEPWNSWGQMLPRFFKPEVAVANHAESGESLRSSLSARRLEKVLSTMKSGDYLFIQFGHNDMKERGDGVGAFTTYKADLKRFVTDAKSKGALPVVVTSMNRKSLKDGEVTNTLGDYPEAVRQVAKEENVPLIDLHAMSKQLYEALGRENIDKAFQDGTHHNNYGSYQLAKCIVEGIRQNKMELAKFILEDVPEFDPKHPDAVETFSIPASADFSNRKPDGS
jgi:lysophospholipase L1-like esterase